MALKAAIKSQLHASLAMLLEVIEACPDVVWTGGGYVNPSWQVAYHALYYTHLYFGQDQAAFVPWKHHRPEYNRLGPASASVPALVPYPQREVADYCRACDAMVDEAIDRLDLEAPDCGFPWYRLTKLEHQFVNIRHVQHHAGQLADRLRQSAGRGVRWVGGGPPSFGR